RFDLFPANNNGVHCLLQTIPDPPKSTLSPYTTLFRSPAEMRVRRACDRRAAAIVILQVPSGMDGGLRGRTRIQRAFQAIPGATLDRKSTRLNSSHVKKSYAVFCLKKKKATN